MNIRKITSLTALVTFLLEALTSVILYIVPQGRVAYWSDWTLWGLSKSEWGNLHVNLGVLFLIAIFLHIYYNWSVLMAYLKNKARQMRVFTREFTAALILTLVFALGTYFEIPPFYTIIEIGEQIKDRAARKYGEPPYGHAELSSLKVFCQKVGIELAPSMAALKQAGIRFADESVAIGEIAKQNGMSPKEIFELIKPKEEPGARKQLPQNPPAGFGNRTLADICHEYDLNMKVIVRALADSRIEAKEAMTIKEIAAANNTSPMDVFEALKAAAATP